MDSLRLEVKRRSADVKPAALRKQGQLPGVIYGHSVQPTSVSIDYPTFEKLYDQAGESTLVDLVVENQTPVTVIIQDVQRDPVGNNFLHVDFHQVRMDEKITTEIELNFTGEAPAVKAIGAILVTNLTGVEIECLPKDLVHEIVVDLSRLKEFGDVIHIADLPTPPGITIKNAADEVVVLIQEPRSEKEVEAAAGPAPEVVIPAETAETEGEQAEGQKTAEPEA